MSARETREVFDLHRSYQTWPGSGWAKPSQVRWMNFVDNKIHHGKSIENLHDRSAEREFVIGWWKINRKNRCLESRLFPLHSFSLWLTQQIIFFSNAPKNRLAEKKSRNKTKREDESSYENPTTAGKDGKTENCSTHMRKVEQSTFYLKRERQQQIKWMSGI